MKRLIAFFKTGLSFRTNKTRQSLNYNIISSNEVEVIPKKKGHYKGIINIPATVKYKGNTYSVTAIGEGAFDNCSDLTSVNIPNTVTSIGNNAFYFCNGLTSVSIPHSVTTIGNSAFYLCHGLTSVNIPNSVTTIGDNAFCFCSNLTSVIIGKSVTTIGDWAFGHCSSLTEIYVKAVNPPSLKGYILMSGYKFIMVHVPRNRTEAYRNAAYWNDFTNIVDDIPDSDE
jgi:hypothetical protein